MDCIDLLVSDDETRIGEILSLLEKSNRHRKGIEDEMFDQAISQVESEGGPGAAIILADTRWHVGKNGRRRFMDGVTMPFRKGLAIAFNYFNART